jgi:hypothetical protein
MQEVPLRRATTEDTCISNRKRRFPGVGVNQSSSQANVIMSLVNVTLQVHDY